MSKETFMEKAIQIAREAVPRGNTPFGALIVKDGEILSEEANEATTDHDPTAHAELLAIRSAAKKLQSTSLAGCELYASGEPCPMCLGAIYTAGIQDVYVAYPLEEGEKYGLGSPYVYEQLAKPSGQRDVPFIPLRPKLSEHPYEVWQRNQQ